MSTPPAPSVRQSRSLATQQRLLDAAMAEFQQYGLAGGRVDRIAERAASNKRLIYVYFGDKDQLFDTVVARHLDHMLDAVPITAHDLPGYAADLLDYFEQRPELLRLLSYRNLERARTTAAESACYERKVAQVREAQEAGLVDDSFPAVQLLAVVLGLVGSWAVASPALREAAEADPSGVSRREVVLESVRRLVAPAVPPA